MASLFESAENQFVVIDLQDSNREKYQNFRNSLQR